MKIEECDGRLVCTLEGHFDTAQSQELEATLKALLKPTQAVTFEMHGVTYVCSCFLRVCVIVSKAAGTGHFTLRGVAPPIKRVFKISGMSELFECE
ncbi:MAG: STAS domain-containing protein [Verrucomicrobiota bacterium]